MSDGVEKGRGFVVIGLVQAVSGGALGDGEATDQARVD